MSLDADRTSAALEAHVRDFFRARSVTTRRWSNAIPGRVSDRFRVLEVEPDRPNGDWIYISIGNWENVHVDRCSLEFILIAPHRSERQVELLTMASYYDRTEHLDLGHVFGLGEPWLPGSTLDAMLVSLPYPFGPKLEDAWVGKKHVRFLWLLPITHAERRYRMERGLEALEARFEANNIDYSRPDRASVVAGPEEN
jgi:hypothetical protein